MINNQQNMIAAANPLAGNTVNGNFPSPYTPEQMTSRLESINGSALAAIRTIVPLEVNIKNQPGKNRDICFHTIFGNFILTQDKDIADSWFLKILGAYAEKKDTYLGNFYNMSALMSTYIFPKQLLEWMVANNYVFTFQGHNYTNHSEPDGDDNIHDGQLDNIFSLEFLRVSIKRGSKIMELAKGRVDSEQAWHLPELGNWSHFIVDSDAEIVLFRDYTVTTDMARAVAHHVCQFQAEPVNFPGLIQGTPTAKNANFKRGTRNISGLWQSVSDKLAGFNSGFNHQDLNIAVWALDWTPNVVVREDWKCEVFGVYAEFVNTRNAFIARMEKSAAVANIQAVLLEKCNLIPIERDIKLKLFNNNKASKLNECIRPLLTSYYSSRIKDLNLALKVSLVKEITKIDPTFKGATDTEIADWVIDTKSYDMLVSVGIPVSNLHNHKDKLLHESELDKALRESKKVHLQMNNNVNIQQEKGDQEETDPEGY